MIIELVTYYKLCNKSYVKWRRNCTVDNDVNRGIQNHEHMSNDIELVKSQGMNVSDAVFHAFDDQVCVGNLYRRSKDSGQVQGSESYHCKKCTTIIKWFVENYSFTYSDGQLRSPDFLQMSFVTPLITLMFSIYFCRIIHPVTFPLKFLDASTNFDV